MYICKHTHVCTHAHSRTSLPTKSISGPQEVCSGLCSDRFWSLPPPAFPHLIWNLGMMSPQRLHVTSGTIDQTQSGATGKSLPSTSLSLRTLLFHMGNKGSLTVSWALTPESDIICSESPSHPTGSSGGKQLRGEGLWTPQFQTFGLSNCTTINHCCFSILTLWSIVIAAPGNSYIPWGLQALSQATLTRTQWRAITVSPALSIQRWRYRGFNHTSKAESGPLWPGFRSHSLSAVLGRWRFSRCGSWTVSIWELTGSQDLHQTPQFGGGVLSDTHLPTLEVSVAHTQI